MKKQPLMDSGRGNMHAVDVREDIRNGREPFSKIMSAVAALPADGQLLLIAPFEPAPLFGVLAKQGFKHESRQLESGDWEVLFTRQPAALPTETAPTSASHDFGHRTAVGQPNVTEVDARGLEPPQPMVKILEALASLPPGAMLQARTDRRPMHLYARLEERGFTGESQEQSDGSFLTHIHQR
ncbi:MAG: DUF2249 domain-containing protein [Verrucomicrobia subdivision 3 bacterium]|nr:DUF2249 domain-containing protein [Limisphaerales bacterium]